MTAERLRSKKPFRSAPHSKRPTQPGVSVGSDQRWTILGVCAFLAVAIWIVFGQTVRHEFVNYDDDVYVYDNPVVKEGLTAEGISRAFTRVHASNWHPLTTLSHMLDCQLYGLNASRHHLTNVLLHGATAILLFLVLRTMTGALWPSAFVAAVFAVHPLRVESVAWVAERKDVLSGLLFMLTLWAYARYAREPKWGARYLLVAVLFALGLMCKPMLVTLPFVLLLLDYWPLRRFGQTGGSALGMPRRLLMEKIPLLLLSGAVCLITAMVQRGVMQPSDQFPLSLRISNAFVSYAAYLGQLIYPVKLAVFYPYPVASVAPGKIVPALLVLAGVSIATIRWTRTRPYLLVGWLWYLGMLVPVIGLIPVGAQARADRYTYLPQIGLCLALVWTVKESSIAWRNRGQWLGVGAAIILTTLIVATRTQTSHWRDNETLWTHTLAVTSPNAVAESNLANALFNQGQLDAAITHFQKALEIKPDYADAHNGLGFAVLQKGRQDQAISHFEKALQLKPALAAAHNNLGMAFLQAGRLNEAITHFQGALSINPEMAEAHNNLGYALLRSGDALAAVTEYQRALEIKPDYVGAANNLAWVLATYPAESTRNGSLAVKLAQQANQLAHGNNLVILRTLAAAHAEAGQFPEAIETARQTLQLAVAQSNGAMANTLHKEIELYQSGQPLRDPAQP